MEEERFEHFGEVAMDAASWEASQSQRATKGADSGSQPVVHGLTRPRGSADNRWAIIASMVVTAALVTGLGYVLIGRRGGGSKSMSTSKAATVAPERETRDDSGPEPSPDRVKPSHEPPTREYVEPTRAPAPDSAAALSARFERPAPYSMPRYLYQVSSDRKFGTAVAQFETLEARLESAGLGSNAEAAVIIHKDGVHFCNVVLWDSPFEPPDWVLSSVKGLLGQGAMLRETESYCACPQSATVPRPELGGSIELIRCHDIASAPAGPCPAAARERRSSLPF